MKRVLLSFFLFTTVFHLTATESVVINEGMFTIDHAKALILCNQNVEELNDQYPGNKSSFFLDDYYDSDYLFSELNIGIAYQVINRNTQKPYTLYFTQLPVINIVCATEIPDEPRVYAQFVMQESNGRKISSNIGIELRGALSQLIYPKKSYRIEFWSDTIGNNTKDYALLEMRSDDDWNLQAMYNEPFRFRNKTSFELWRKIHIPTYIASEPNAINGVRMEYAEIFVNGNYMGVFGVGERIDRKQLKLKKYNNGEIRGELYKGNHYEGGPVFEGPIPPVLNGEEFWNNFEYEYPDEIPSYWNNLYNLISFVVNEPDNYFYENYQSQFDLNSLVDYFIFLNLTHAIDNTGKNTYLARYDKNTPYFYAPWDLDGVFGNSWDGTVHDVVDNILFNNLFDRVWRDWSENGFRHKLNERWNALRTNVIIHDDIMNMFRGHFEYLKQNAVYEREAISWPEYVYDESLLYYMSDWLSRRIAFLDFKFNEGFPTAISENEYPIFALYPNPVSNQLTIIMPEDCHSMMFTLFDMQGKEIIKREISTTGAISLELLPSGFYLYKISSDQHHQMGKIVKE